MNAHVLWTGVEYHSIEYCIVRSIATGAEVISVIVGFYEGVIYKLNYRIKTNPLWETEKCSINFIRNGERTDFHFERNGGKWIVDGKEIIESEDCIDVDIPVTPFTNSLPINRLKLQNGESQVIKVLYIDLLQNEIKVVSQRYTRLSQFAYKYENIPNDFEASITVDENGLVENYPELFTRPGVANDPLQ